MSEAAVDYRRSGIAVDATDRPRLEAVAEGPQARPAPPRAGFIAFLREHRALRNAALVGFGLVAAANAALLAVTAGF